MYLSGVITIDPTQLTHLERVKPTKGFARMAHLLTGGLVTPQQERETFCAITILQQINRVMRSLGIDNVVRLAKDNTVFYEDSEGKTGDLKQAFDKFQNTAVNVSLFDTLVLVLEHHTQEQSYLIEIRIRRTHRVGEHPIQVVINGLPREFSTPSSGKVDPQQVQRFFDTQHSYDQFVDRQRETFERFLGDIEGVFEQYIAVDKINVTSKIKIIRPTQRINRRADIPRAARDHNDPIYEGYYGFDDAFFYAWIWADLCFTHDIHCCECTIVDEAGCDVLDVGYDGFQAGDGDTMNVDASFETPSNGDCEVVDGSMFGAEVSTDSSKPLELGGGGDTSGSWLSSAFESVGDTGGSSCGGGCGGCGGD